jgi:hypothetical protein
MNIGSQDQWELEDNHPLHMMHWCVANCVRTTNTGRCAFHRAVAAVSVTLRSPSPNFEQLNPDSDSIAVRSGQFLKCTPVLLIIGANFVPLPRANIVDSTILSASGVLEDDHGTLSLAFMSTPRILRTRCGVPVKNNQPTNQTSSDLELTCVDQDQRGLFFYFFSSQQTFIEKYYGQEPTRKQA